MDYDEGVNLHAAWLLAHGDNIYLPNPPDRFISAPYPPLMYLLTVPTLWLGGLQLLGPRLIVLAGTLAIGGLLVYLVRREGAGMARRPAGGRDLVRAHPGDYLGRPLQAGHDRSGPAAWRGWPCCRRTRGARALLGAGAVCAGLLHQTIGPGAGGRPGVAWLFLRDRRGAALRRPVAGRAGRRVRCGCWGCRVAASGSTPSSTRPSPGRSTTGGG